mmetsp:Transcript_14214/g.42321  ORF Transcript_14214/g.42321 Transcript_14214/m.42321 type:complete len:318 (+) Transcript_14214:208-1161(+)
MAFATAGAWAARTWGRQLWAVGGLAASVFFAGEVRRLVLPRRTGRGVGRSAVCRAAGGTKLEQLTTATGEALRGTTSGHQLLACASGEAARRPEAEVIRATPWLLRSWPALTGGGMFMRLGAGGTGLGRPPSGTAAAAACAAQRGAGLGRARAQAASPPSSRKLVTSRREPALSQTLPSDSAGAKAGSQRMPPLVVLAAALTFCGEGARSGARLPVRSAWGLMVASQSVPLSAVAAVRTLSHDEGAARKDQVVPLLVGHTSVISETVPKARSADCKPSSSSSSQDLGTGGSGRRSRGLRGESAPLGLSKCSELQGES